MKFIQSGFIDEIGTDFEKQLKVSHDLGMTHVCLRSIGKVNIGDMSLQEVASNIVPLLRKYQLAVACLGTPLGKVFIYDDEAIENQKKSYAHIAAIARLLDCQHIRAFSYYIPTGSSSDLFREKVLANLNKMVAAFAGESITVLHENEKGIYGYSATHCLDLLKTIDSPYFRAIFDFANFVQCQEDPLAAYASLKPYIDDFHIKDALFTSSKNVLCGTGSGQIATILQDASTENKDYFATLEPHLVVFDALANLELEPVEGILGDNDFKTGEEGFVAQHAAFLKILQNLVPKV
jgi:sugar phosphate isomerase/epimerase